MYGYKCEYCNGTVRPRPVEREVFKHKKGFVILENVVIGVCDGCGDRYYSAEILHTVHEIATDAANRSGLRPSLWRMQDKQARWFLREPPVFRCHRLATMMEPAGNAQEPMEDLQDELCWDSLFERTQSQLVVAARRAKQQITVCMATPMDYSRL